jgi:adenylosuccinate lyase
MKSWEEGGAFLDALAADPEVAGVLDATALEALFDYAHHTRHVDTIFERVFGGSD